VKENEATNHFNMVAFNNFTFFTICASITTLLIGNANGNPIIGNGRTANANALQARSSLQITEHSTGGTYDCSPRDIHCCEQTISHKEDRKQGGAGAGGSGSSASTSGANGKEAANNAEAGAANPSASASSTNNERRSNSGPFEAFMQVKRGLVSNVGVNCSVSSRFIGIAELD
jgi:hypothetical protein